MIVDGFIFYNEFNMLESRLEYLYDSVDRFVIVECDHTFAGNRKDYNLDLSKYPQYVDKIHHVKWSINSENYNFGKPTELDLSRSNWKLYYDQQDQIARSIVDLPDDTVVFISDIDEIPNRENFKYIQDRLNSVRMIALEQDFYYYNLNTKLKSLVWASSAVTTKRVFEEKLPHQVRIDARYVDLLINGGWHLSYFMSPKMIANKLANFSHQELNTDYLKDEGRIGRRILEGVDLFDNRSDYVFEDVGTDRLPPEFLKCFNKFTLRNTALVAEWHTR